MEKTLLTMGGVLAVIVALVLFWQLSQNGRYTFMHHPGPEDAVIVLDTRTMDVRVRLLDVKDRWGKQPTYHWVRVAPDKEPYRP